MAQHRTAAERIADLEAKTAALRAKAAREQLAEADPEVKQMAEQLTSLKKRKTEFALILAPKGPTSATERRAKHVAWIEKIDTAEREAKEQSATIGAEIEFLSRQLDARIATLAKEQATGISAS